MLISNFITLRFDMIGSNFNKIDIRLKKSFQLILPSSLGQHSGKGFGVHSGCGGGCHCCCDGSLWECGADCHALIAKSTWKIENTTKIIEFIFFKLKSLFRKLFVIYMVFN